MTDIILHHYRISPFSAKARAALGYLELPWRSVIVAETPPRKPIAPLVGNYQRIPVAQVGADIFCDTKTIFTYLAEHANKPELDPNNSTEEQADFNQHIERDFCFASVTRAVGWPLIKKSMRHMDFQSKFTIMFDRMKMGRDANIKMPTPKEAEPILAATLPQLEQELSGADRDASQQPFFGGALPAYRDFCVYHSLWMLETVGEKNRLENHFSHLKTWYDAMLSFGEGTPSEFNSRDALDCARQNDPAPIAPQLTDHPLIGHVVSITPNDYRIHSTRGVLRGASDNTYILERETPETGIIHQHFPTQGFTLTQN